MADMPIPPLFVPIDDVYGADELSLLLKDIITTEGLVNKAGGDGAVTQRGAGANMSVDVAAIAKGAYIKGDDDANAQGVYRVRSAATVNLAIAANGAGSTRIDLIVARVYDSTFVGLSNKWTLEVVQGVAGAGTPATPNGAIALATVSVASGAASIVNANITDARPTYSLYQGGNTEELAYAEVTADTNATATTEGTATTLITCPAIAVDGATTIILEAMMQGLSKGSTKITAVFHDGSGSIGKGIDTSDGTSGSPKFMTRRYTPSAGTKTYSLRAFVDGGTGKIQAGAGGSGNVLPSYLRVKKAA